MGNQNCCEAKNIDMEQAGTTLPFAHQKSSNSNFSSVKSSFKDKENSVQKSATTIDSRDSTIIGNVYKQIQQSVFDVARKPVTLFGRAEMTQTLAAFSQSVEELEENLKEQLKKSPEALQLPKAVEATLNFYRGKLRKEYPENVASCTSKESYVAKGGVKFCGTLLNGTIKGWSIVMFSPKSFFEGEMCDSLPNGVGVMFYTLSLIYFGTFRNGRRSGKGTLELRSTEIYAGDWIDDLPHGHGREIIENGDVYEGGFVRGLKEGRGTLKFADGSQFTGTFSKDLINGTGEFTSSKFNYKGEYKDNKKHGFGEFVWANGARYTGHFRNGKREGYGEYIDENNKSYKGRWKEGCLDVEIKK